MILRTSDGVPAAPRVVSFDRPFLYLIVDEPTGSILFIGHVTQP